MTSRSQGMAPHLARRSLHLPTSRAIAAFFFASCDAQFLCITFSRQQEVRGPFTNNVRRVYIHLRIVCFQHLALQKISSNMPHFTRTKSDRFAPAQFRTGLRLSMSNPCTVWVNTSPMPLESTRISYEFVSGVFTKLQVCFVFDAPFDSDMQIQRVEFAFALSV